MTLGLAAWGWALASVGIFLAVGIALWLLLGVAGWPADTLRRLGQAARRPRVHRGLELPDEVRERGSEPDR